MTRKWYVAGTCAEGRSGFIVELSNAEFKAVQKFVDASGDNLVFDGGWSGSFWIDPTPYDTKEEANSACLSQCC